MTFLNIILLGGITTAAIPLIIYLLNRNRFQHVRWGAMHLIESVVRTNRRRISIEQLILLLVRTAIPAVLAFCMARPVLTGMKGLVRNARTSMVVLLDNSFSMEAGDAVRSNFSQAKEEVGRIVDGLPRGSEFAVAGLAGPIPSMSGATYDIPKAMKTLNEEKGGFGIAKVPAALETAVGLFASKMNHADRELVIVSDFQTVSWSDKGDDARTRALDLLKAQPVPCRTVLFRVGKEINDNVAVESLKLSRSLVGVGQKVQIRANVRSFGSKNYPDLRIYFKVDGKEKSVSQLSLGPNERGQVLFTHKFEEAGSHVVEVFADADRLKADNTCLASLPVLDQLPVLLVTGDASTEPLKGETAFLEIALQPFKSAGTAGLADLIRTVVVREEQFSHADLPSYRVVVLANVRQLSEDKVRGLEEFVRAGGGLLVFPGDRISAPWYNTKLVDQGNGLLPYRIVSLAGSVREDVEPAEIISQHYEHSSLEPFNDPRSGSLRGGQIRLWYKTEQPMASLPPESEYKVIARLDTGDPFLVEKKFGEGRIIQCCTAADADWSNLPMRPFYLPLVQQLATYLASKVYPPRNVEVGQRLATFVPVADAGKKVVVTTPAQAKHEVEIVANGMHGVADFSRSEKPGLYLMTTPAGEEVHFVVNTPRAESDIARLDDNQFKSLAAEMGATTVKSWKEYQAVEQDRRFGQEIWKVMLLVVLALVFTELFLIRFFTRRVT